MASNKETALIEIVLKGQAANASLKDMDKAVRALGAQLKNLPKDSQQFADKKAEFQKMSKTFKDLQNDVRGIGGAFNQINNESTSFFGKLKTGVLSVFGGNLITNAVSSIKNVFMGAIDNQREFEKSLKNLSAITGASGDDLKYYKEQAISMSAGVAGGASAVVEAFKFIGSAKPELLNSKEALAQVTQQAILLSQAAGIDLPEASLRLTDAMNQFGAPAEEAAKYVDALAAGAKYGATEVPEVTDSLLKFGVAAKSSNINIYESVAAIELLGEKGLKGAEAGTQLRNIFAKLSAAKILPKEALDSLKSAGVNISILSDKTLPLQTRLTELSKIQGDAATITRVFGLENKNAGEALISNLGRLEKLTSQVQENGVAMKQAATNMDTLDQATIEAKNAWDNMLLSFTSGDFGEVIKGFVKKATIGLNELKISLSGIGTLLSTGSIFQAAENTADQRMKDFIKLTVSQMTKATREKVLAQEKIEAEAMIKAIKNVKNVSEEELKIYSKNIQSKIFLIKEIEKYQNKSSKESIAANTDEGSKIVAIDEETKKKLIDNFKKLQETLDQLEHEHQLAKMSDDDRELQLIHDKYNKLRKDAKGHSEELKRIQALEDEDIFDLIVKKFAKEGEAETKGYFDRLKRLEQLEKQKTKITDTGNSGSKNLSEAEKFKAESKKLAEEFDNRIAEAKAFNESLYVGEESYFIDIETLTKMKNDAIEALNKEHNNNLSEEDKKANKKRLEVYKSAYGYISDIWSSFDKIRSNNEDYELKKDVQRNNDKKNHYKRLLDAKAISQRQYDDKINKINEEQLEKENAIKRKQEQREKRAAIIKATINTAVAVAEQAPNYILMALTAALGALQIGVIASQPSAYAKGGYNLVSNDPQGFTKGSTLYTNSASGKPFIAGEAGKEWISPSWMVNDPVIGPNIQALESIRVRGFAAGGSNGSEIPSLNHGTSSQNLNNSQLNNSDIANAINTLNSIMSSGIIAYMSYDDNVKAMSDIDKARKAAQFRK